MRIIRKISGIILLLLSLPGLSSYESFFYGLSYAVGKLFSDTSGNWEGLLGELAGDFSIALATTLVIGLGLWLLFGGREIHNKHTEKESAPLNSYKPDPDIWKE